MWIIIALLASFAFHVDTNDNMDFVRYMDILSSIRHSDISFLDFWIYGTQASRWAGTAQIYAYGENILIYLVGRYLQNDYILVWISILIDYTCVIYVAYDLNKDKKLTFREVIFNVLICFAELPFIHACSGLRTATAACVMTVGIYDFLYKNESFIKFIILSVVAVSFHPFVLFAIPLCIVIRISVSRIVFAIVLISTAFLQRLVSLFGKSGIPFLIMLSKKYISYTSENQFRAYRTFEYGTIVICVLFIIYIVFTQFRIITAKDTVVTIGNAEKIKLFSAAYMATIMGFIGSYELVVRSGYLLGAMSPILTMILYEEDSSKVNGYLKSVIRVLILMIILIMSVTYIKYYHQFFH